MFPEYADNDYLHRAIELHRHIIKEIHSRKKTKDLRQKCQSIQMLCYLYRAAGKYELVKELAENMPEIYQSRPALLYHSMPDSQIKEGIRAYINQFLNTTEAMIAVLLCHEPSNTHGIDGHSDDSCLEYSHIGHDVLGSTKELFVELMEG